MISYPLSMVVRIAWGCKLKTTNMTSLGSETLRPIGTVFSYKMQSLWHAYSPKLFHLLSQQLLKMASCSWKNQLAAFCLYKIPSDTHKFLENLSLGQLSTSEIQLQQNNKQTLCYTSVLIFTHSMWVKQAEIICSPQG